MLCVSSLSEACVWSTIKKVDGGYLYSRDCHIQVGMTLEELDLRTQQAVELQKALDSQKDATRAETGRADLWYNEAKKLDNHIKAQDTAAPFKNAMWFVLGAGLMYGASRVGK